MVGPLDRATKTSDGYGASAFVPKLANAQRQVAHEAGCAYWDTFGAMGGSGSMGIWVQRGLGQADLAHPSGAGAEVLGNWIYLALMDGYEAFKQRESGKSGASAPATASVSASATASAPASASASSSATAKP